MYTARAVSDELLLFGPVRVIYEDDVFVFLIARVYLCAYVADYDERPPLKRSESLANGHQKYVRS